MIYLKIVNMLFEQQLINISWNSNDITLIEEYNNNSMCKVM